MPIVSQHCFNHFPLPPPLPAVSSKDPSEESCFVSGRAGFPWARFRPQWQLVLLLSMGCVWHFGAHLSPMVDAAAVCFSTGILLTKWAQAQPFLSSFSPPLLSRGGSRGSGSVCPLPAVGMPAVGLSSFQQLVTTPLPKVSISISAVSQAICEGTP